MANYKSIIISVLSLLLCVAEAESVDIPDHMRELVPARHVTYDDLCGMTAGAYSYDQVENRFYVSAYGATSGIRCFIPGGVSEPNYAWPFKVANVIIDASGVSWQCATVSDLLRVMGSGNIAAGTFKQASASIINGMVLNPEAIKVNGTNYPAGSMMVISDDSTTTDSSWQKRLVSWDLREIGSPIAGFDPNTFDPNVVDPSSPFYDPDQLPDRANAQYESGGMLEVERFGQEFGYGCVNWNDAFNSLLTARELGSALGYYHVTPVTTDRCADGNVCFSTDGKKVYFSSKDTNSGGLFYKDSSGKLWLSTGKTFTGIWSKDLTTGAVRRLFNDTSSDDDKSIVAEMTIVPVGLRNLTGLPYADNVDQLLFNGSDASGNICGVNCMILDGSDNPPIYTLIRGVDVLDFMEADLNNPAYYGIVNGEPATYPRKKDCLLYDPANPDPDLYINPAKWPKAWAITHDRDGNIYIYYRNPHSVYMYDTKGRLVCVKNKPQSVAYNLAFMQGNIYYCENIRLSVRYVDAQGQLIPQLMYMSTGTNGVGGIDVYKPCDFDRDGQVTAADMDLFEIQIQKTRAGVLPGMDDPGYQDYLKADLNGNGKVVNDLGAASRPVGRDDTELLNFSVTEKDIEILYEFVMPGDTNLDKRVDMLDYAVIADNFLKGNSTVMSWSQGDFDFDEDVDIDDLILFADSWMKNDE